MTNAVQTLAAAVLCVLVSCGPPPGGEDAGAGGGSGGGAVTGGGTGGGTTGGGTGGGAGGGGATTGGGTGGGTTGGGTGGGTTGGGTGGGTTGGGTGGGTTAMAPAGLTYSTPSPVYVRSLAIPPNTPSSTGGAVDSYSVAPALPAGLTLSTTTGIITGTPTALSPLANFVITATNIIGSTQVTLGISVVDRPTLSFTGATGTTGTIGALMTVTPTTLAGNGAAVTQCGIKPATPALPAGLTVSPTTCVISGTPTSVTASAVYTLIATNTVGDSAEAPVTLSITAPPAVLTISDGPTYAFGSWGTGTVAEHAFSVTNSGTGIATGLTSGGAIGAAFAFKGGTFPGLGGNCTSTLTVGSTCVFVVTFSPTSVASFAGTISLAYSDLGQARTATRTVSGAGTALAVLAITDYPPQIYVQLGLPADPPTFDFGLLGLGATREHTFYVTNNGASPATISGGGTLAAPFAFKGLIPGAGGNCASSLNPGETCFVIVTFSPTTAATDSAILMANYTGGVSASVSRNLTGTGTAAAAVAIFDFPNGEGNGGVNLGASWDFGTVGLGANSEKTFLVINSGGSSATGLGAGAASAPFTFPGGFPGGPVGSSAPDLNGAAYCGSTLPAGGYCAITVRFSPTTAVASTGSIAVAYGTAQTATRAVTGVGTQLALLSIREARDGFNPSLVFDYELRATSSTTGQVFLVTNSGAQAATALTAAALPTGFAFSGAGFPGGTGSFVDREGNSIPWCTAAGSLSATSVCAMSVDFRPTASGSYSGAVALSYGNGSATVSASRSIQGQATTLAIVSISTCFNCGGGFGDPQFDFGTVPVSTTRTGVALISNRGLAAATLTSGALTGGNFSYMGVFPGGTGTANVNGTDYPFCGPSPYSLASGVTCAVRVQYTAPSTSGSQVGRMTVNTANAALASVSMDLTASSTNLAIVSLQSAYGGGGNGGGGTPTEDFGYVPTGATRTTWFRLDNSGLAPATVTSGVLTGTGYAFTSGTYPGGTPGSQVNLNGSTYSLCPAAGSALAAGSSCVVAVTYTASGTAPQSGALSIALTGATQAAVAYNLRATPTTLAIISLSTNPGGGGGGPCCGAPTYDFGTVASSTTSSAFFFLSNSGASPATVTSGTFSGTAFSYPSGSYPGGTPGSSVNVFGSNYTYCAASGQTLAPGATCVIQVRYSASGSVPQTGSISLTLGGATSPSLASNLSGTPTTAAIVSISTCPNCGGGGGGPGTPTHDFGMVPSPSTQAQFFFIRNAGIGSASLTQAGVNGTGFAYAGSGVFPGGTAGSTVNIQGMNFNYCPASGGNLPGGATCVIQITWSATGNSPQSGSFNISLQGATTGSIGYLLTGSPSMLAIVNIVQCLGCGGPGSSFDFGTAGTALDAVLLVQNTGVASAGLSGGSTLLAPFSWTTGTYPGGTGSTNVQGQSFNYCSTSLGAGAACAISVRYSGASTATGMVTLNLTGAASSTASSGLQGTATTRALLTISESEGFFGCADFSCGGRAQFPGVAAPGPVAQDFLVSNRGALATSSISAGTAFSSAFGFGTAGTLAYPGGTGTRAFNGGSTSYPYCGVVLAPGAQCIVTVNFHPAAAATQYDSAVNLQFSDAGGAVSPNANRNITGTSF